VSTPTICSAVVLVIDVVHHLEKRAKRSLDVEVTSNTRADEFLVNLLESLRLADALAPVLFDDKFAVGKCALSSRRKPLIEPLRCASVAASAGAARTSRSSVLRISSRLDALRIPSVGSMLAAASVGTTRTGWSLILRAAVGLRALLLLRIASDASRKVARRSNLTPSIRAVGLRGIITHRCRMIDGRIDGNMKDSVNNQGNQAGVCEAKKSEESRSSGELARPLMDPAS
jgi:hypothetical protein